MAVTAQLIRYYISSSIQLWKLRPSLFNRISILILRSTISKPLRSFPIPPNPTSSRNSDVHWRERIAAMASAGGRATVKVRMRRTIYDGEEEEEIMKGFIQSGWVLKWVITGDPVLALGVVIEEIDVDVVSVDSEEHGCDVVGHAWRKPLLLL